MDNNKTVQQVINFIEQNILNDLSLKEIAQNVSYSPWYISRIFQKTTHVSIQSYIKKRRMSLAAIELRDTKRKIIDIAVDYGYQSQEAFTRTFCSLFQLPPNEYRQKKVPIPLICKIDVTHFEMREEKFYMKNFEKDVTVTFMKKEKRKLYYVQRKEVTNYHEFCEQPDAEELWGKLTSMPDTLSGVVCGWLNENQEDSYFWGVELPSNYDKSYDWLKEASLDKCEYAVFLHAPYEESAHDDVIQAVWNASENWNPESKQYLWAMDKSPIYENETEEGYMVIKPVKKV